MNRWRGDTVILIYMTQLMVSVETSASRICLSSILFLLGVPQSSRSTDNLERYRQEKTGQAK